VQFLKDASGYVPRLHADEPLQELKWLYQRSDLPEARTALAEWIGKWTPRQPRLAAWVDDNVEPTLTFFGLPRQHRKHVASTVMLERLNEEIRKRADMVRVFPNVESCMRVMRALAVETHENWMAATNCLNMDELREYRKMPVRQAA
jgi:transposase-like protein